MEKHEMKLNTNELRQLRVVMDEFFRKGSDIKLREMFRFYDRNENGRIDVAELKSVMEQVSQGRVGDEDIRLMMQEADTNKNGTIEYPEFCEIMLKYRRNHSF